MSRKKLAVKPVRFPEADADTAAELIRRTFQALGEDRSRKFNWWLSPDNHCELTRRAYAFCHEHGFKKPSLTAYLEWALDLPSHAARLERDRKRAQRRLRVVK